MNALSESESKAALKALSAGTTLRDTRFARTKFSWPRKSFRNVSFADCDLGAPLLGGILRRPKIENCRFERCQMDGLNIVTAEIEGVSFVASSIGREFHAAFIKTRLEQTQFESCWLSFTQFTRCELESCSFLETKGNKIIFRESTLSHCTFSGRPGTVHFVECHLESVDFESFRPEDLCFVDCTFSETIVPENDSTEVLNRNSEQGGGGQAATRAEST